MAQTHTSVPCPSCKRPLLGGVKACPGCGWSSVAQTPPPSAPPAGAPAFRPCPSCGSEAVQRVPAVVGYQTPEMTAFFLGGGLLLLALSGLCWWRFARHQGELAEEKRGSLFYCARCDAVYDPASGRAASPHEIGTLVG